MRIDVHAHLAQFQGTCRGETYRDFPEALANLKRSMQANGIDHTILIPENYDDNPEMPGLRQMLALIGGDQSLSCLGCPRIIQEKSGDLEYFRDLLARGVIKGLKFFPGHDPHYADDERCRPYFVMCQSLGAPVVFHSTDTDSNPPGRMCGPNTDPKLIAGIAKQYPDLRVVLAHFHWPKYEYCYETTRGIPNLYFDLSGVVDDDESPGTERIREPLLKVLAEDPRRVIFGTDWMEADPTKHVAMVEALPIEENVKQMVFSENAVRTYNLKL